MRQAKNTISAWRSLCASLLFLPLLADISGAQIDTSRLYRPKPSASMVRTGSLLAGYGYDGTHGPRLGVGSYAIPSGGMGFFGYGWTGTIDARFSSERTLVEPAVGGQMWLLFLSVGAEVAAPTNFERLWVVPRFHFGLGMFGTRITFLIAAAPEVPPGMGRLGVQLEVPVATLWETEE